MSPTPRRTGDHGPVRGPAGLVETRQLERSVTWSGLERFRCYWYRLRLTIAEMNYATRRLAELQAFGAERDQAPRSTPRGRRTPA